MFYGARKEQFVPRFMIQHTITNKETNEFIERVIESQGMQFEVEGGVLVCLTAFSLLESHLNLVISTDKLTRNLPL